MCSMKMLIGMKLETTEVYITVVVKLRWKFYNLIKLKRLRILNESMILSNKIV